MKRGVFLWLALLLTILAGASGCESGGTIAPPTCEPSCGPCQTCDTSGETPACVDTCGDGTVCENNQCVAPPVKTCEGGCGPCQSCDTSGETPTCKDICADGMTCENNQCVAPPVKTCEGGCGPCQSCDTSGETPTCKDICADGMTCENNQCVAPPAPTCEGGCGPCQSCDTSGETPTCKDICADGMTCENNQCVAPPAPTCEGGCGPCQVCDASGDTPACISLCSSDETCDGSSCVKENLHAGISSLQGPFADGPSVTAACLECHESAGNSMLKSPHWTWLGETPQLEGHTTGAEVGKQNLINNFCIAVRSNEKRCAECHAGYGYDSANFDFQNPGKIDCLVCHSAPTSGYTKDPKNAGQVASSVNLVKAATSVGRPQRANCGSCHFDAGGGDNVKNGDLGSALAEPALEVDVHMGMGFACADCHAGSQHALLGQGVHLPVSEGRIGCADCHTTAPHVGENSEALNNHALDVACQTCHIPAFSKTQPTMTWWDWSTAGNKGIGTNGIQTGTLPDGTQVVTYNYQKGTFEWEKNVRPTYGWYNGDVSRMTIFDQYDALQGTVDSPAEQGRSLADADQVDAMIYPFKRMLGRQPAEIHERYFIVPQLFGTGGFWAGIPPTYDPAAVEQLWTTSLTNGARAAGQLGPEESYTSEDWDWVYTVLYLGINHEVAPASGALGCTDCHTNPDFDFESLGYACDPMTNPSGCGSRH